MDDTGIFGNGRNLSRRHFLRNMALTASASVLRPWQLFGTPAGAAGSGAAAITGDERMRWWREAKFGMFIHWGLYSVPAGAWKGKTNYAEWIMKNANIPSSQYEKFAAQFNPEEFDAEEWVRVAKDAGMKYLVITSKHHDGFSMYDTALTDYNIVDATPFGRDPMKELAPACREAGLKFCFYYSIPDWHHRQFPAKYSQGGFHGDPNPNADLDKYVEYMKGQVRELLTNYGPIGILWFDSGGSFRGYDIAKLIHAQEIIDMIRDLQPECIINNRLGLPADYGTPEQRIPGGQSEHDFEVCMTLNDHWGYNKNDDNWKEAPEVIHKLTDIASKGGNYLLNVGPNRYGNFPMDATRILGEVSPWMQKYGDSIYRTHASPFAGMIPFFGRVTQRDNMLFLHVFEWPAKRQLELPGLKTRVREAHLLGRESQSLSVDYTGPDRTPVISLPEEAPQPIDSVVVVTLEGSPQVEPLTIRPNASGVVDLPAYYAEIEVTGYRQRAKPMASNGRMFIGNWGTSDNLVVWEFTLPKANKYKVQVDGKVPSSQSAGQRVEIAVDDDVTVSGKIGGNGVAINGTLSLRAGQHKLAAKLPDAGRDPQSILDLYGLQLVPAR